MGNTATNKLKRRNPKTRAVEETRCVSQDEIATVFDSLTDQDACTILQMLGQDSLSAKEIATECELPMSTAYRKLNQLSDAGLLEEETEVSLDGKHVTRYVRCIDEISIKITESGFELQLSGAEQSSDNVFQL